MRHIVCFISVFVLLTTTVSAQTDLRSRSVFVEGEDFVPSNADWVAGKGWADDIYSATSGDAVLGNAGGGSGVASKDVVIPAAGKYNVWVRYLKIGAYAGTFGLKIAQNGATVFDKEYRTRAEGGGWDPVWEKFEGDLQAGPATLTLYLAKPGIRQKIDCVLITSDLSYTKPEFKDFAPQTFLRFKLTEPAVPVTVKARTYLKREPVYYFDPGTITSKGLNVAGDPIAAGEWSPWVDFSRYMDSGEHQTTVKLAFFSGDKPLAHVKAIYQLAPVADEARARVLDEDVDGEISSLILPGDTTKFPQVVALASALTAKHLTDAQALQPAPIAREPQMPLEAYICGYGDAYHSPTMLSQEAQTARLLGFNSFNDFYGERRKIGEAAGYKRGFLSQWFTSKAWECPSNPKMQQLMEGHFKGLAEKMLKEDPEAFKHVTRNILYDEPGTSNLRHMMECKDCLAGFAPYLQRQGLRPQDFGQETWDKVRLIDRGDAVDEWSRRMYYWSVQYRDWMNAMLVKAGTDAAEKYFGKQILNGVNFTNGPISGWIDKLSWGPDWFLYGRLRSQTLMWSEDWASLGPEVSGLIVDMLRGAARPNRLAVGTYVIANNVPTLEQRTFSAIMHGAKAIHFYCYGPYYAFGDGMIPDSPETEKALARTIRLIAAADPWLYPAQVQPAQVAILWGKSHEIWEKDTAVNTERRTMYLACQQAHVPVDMVCEDDIADGLLKGYKVLYVTESNVSRGAYRKLMEWVKAGGVLQLGAGALRLDEYNEALTDEDSAKVEKPAGDYREHYGIPAQTPRGEVTLAATKWWPACKFPLLGYKEETPAAGETLATFADGKPAVTLTRVGKGSVLRFAFMPGLGYVKTAQPKATEIITGYDPAQLKVLTAGIALAGAQPPLVVSEPLVEAQLLRGPKADVVVLGNWAGKDALPVLMTVKGAAGRKISAASGAAVKVTKAGNDAVVALTLGAADVLVVR